MHHDDVGVLPQMRGHHPSREGEIDESVETDVLKVILLREEYISRLEVNLENQVSKFGKDQAAFDDLFGLLDLLRSTTVDAVEAIQRWRRVRGNPMAPFSWKNMNYLLKISIDLDFVHRHKVSPPLKQNVSFLSPSHKIRRL